MGSLGCEPVIAGSHNARVDLIAGDVAVSSAVNPGERAALRAWYASLETPVLDAGLE
jgi:hypothetical protein